MGFLGFKSETFHHGIKSLRACGDTSLECAQQREGEAGEAREAWRCGCWKQREWRLHNAAVLPAGLAVQASLCISILPSSQLSEAPKQRLPLLVSGGCRMATQGIPDRNLLAFLSHSTSTVVLIARVLDTAPWSLVCVVFCVVVGQHATPRRDFSPSLGPVVVPVATVEAR